MPEEFASHQGKYTAELNVTGKIFQSCIHCHMVRDADRRERRDAGEAFPYDLLYPWPLPDVVNAASPPLWSTAEPFCS